MTLYTIDPPRPSGPDTKDGPWRVTPFGNKYARVVMADGRLFHVGVEKDKRVRIPYKPRGANYGWTYYGFVKDGSGKVVASDRVAGSIGVRGLLKMAGLVPLTAKEAEAAAMYADWVARGWAKP
jgi:hypothetical protein